MAGPVSLHGGGTARPDRLTTRARLVRAAVQLFQARGYAGVGTAELLAEAGAPKGVLYHHFPGGKAELAVAAVAWLEAEVLGALAAARAGGASGAALVTTMAEGVAAWLARPEGRGGGLLAALAAGLGPDEAELQAAIGRAYGAWRTEMAAIFVADGHPPARAASLADLALAVTEGGTSLARAAGGPAPLLAAAALVAELAARTPGKA